MVLSPLTGSENVTQLKVIQVKALINGWKNRFEIDIAEELHGYEEIYLYRCNDTGLKFFTPFSTAGSSRLYEQLQQFNWYYMPDKWEYQVACSSLLDCQKNLEIGAGNGAFIKVSRAAGIDIKGIELNKAAVKQAQAKSLPVEYLDLRKAAEIYSGSLDGVCSFQVLEHVPNPRDFINWSLQMLKPGGKLIYSVPNCESFLQYDEDLLEMPPHHMLLWSKSIFKALEKVFPLKLEKILVEPLAAYHVNYYLVNQSKRFRSISPLGKLIFNRHTFPVYEKCLDAGMRKLCIGHTLYAEFRKLI